MADPKAPSKPQSAVEPSPFLPDLCSLQAVLFLVLGTELLALVVALMQSNLKQFDWPFLGQISMLLLWISLSSAGILCQLRHGLGRWPAWLAGVFCYLLVLSLALLFTVAGQWLLRPAIDWFVVIKIEILAAIISGVVLRYMYLQQQLSNQQQASNRAQIYALQARIRPHFLFNSINAVVSLIGFDPDKAERVLLDLCDLFRAAIAEPALVPLKKEITLVKQYLEIEQLRLGKRLQIEWRSCGECDDCQIPSMILQPIVENAVYHGIEPRADGGLLTIDTKVQGEMVDITITNPLSERGVVRTGNGIAQDNIRARLAAHYGTQATFVAAPVGDQYEVKLKYPWRHAKLIGKL